MKTNGKRERVVFRQSLMSSQILPCCGWQSSRIDSQCCKEKCVIRSGVGMRNACVSTGSASRIYLRSQWIAKEKNNLRVGFDQKS